MICNNGQYYLNLDFTEAEERGHCILLQYPVVAFTFEAVFGEVLGADVAVFCRLEVVPPHRSNPFSANVWSGEGKSKDMHACKGHENTSLKV